MNMKNKNQKPFARRNQSKIVNFLLLISFGLLTGCQQPDELLPSVARLSLNSIVASFVHPVTGEIYGEFTGNTPEKGNEIIVVIPYYYPEDSEIQVTNEQLKKMRVRAILDDNVTINPPLLYLDMTQNNKITMTDQRKEKRDFIIRGEIRKSNVCKVEDFFIPSLSISGIINESEKTISLPNYASDALVLANVRLSHHATISPDPEITPMNYNNDVKLTVTAHDGVTQSVYTVKSEIASKIPYGMRPNSAKILFEKRMRGDLGIPYNLTRGIAATKDYVIINVSGQNSVYIHAKTGEKVGEIDLGPVKGAARNYYTTSDAAGNVVICNRAPNDGSFKVWKLTSMNGSTDLFINWTVSTTDFLGGKISIQGNINGNAIITAPLYSYDFSQRFVRWKVENGVLTSQTPDIVTVTGLAAWTDNCDIIYTSETDITSDYFLAAYIHAACPFVWVNGATNAVRRTTAGMNSNFVPNAVDYTVFNHAKFVTVNWVNAFAWGYADKVWLLDVTSDANFTGNLENETCPAVVWECKTDFYGPKALGLTPNSTYGGDVALFVSPDGYYLYLYFMFTNGYVVGVQFDCIDM